MNYTEDQLTVYLHNKPVLQLNGTLAKRQGVTPDRLERLKALHVRRLQVEEQLQTCRLEERRVLLDTWSHLQFQLQKQWGFPEDAKFHRFWDIPGCSCSPMDNSDAYPSGYYSVDSRCRIHGTT